MKLYNQLAKLYDDMYTIIWDYDSEFALYDRLLKKYKCKKILEVACGTGVIAKKLYDKGYNVSGLDLFPQMLSIAKRRAPKVKFYRDDMRNFNLRQKFDAIIVTGTGFAYMLKNDDVEKALSYFHKNLKKGGLLIFDNYDAKFFLTKFEKDKISNVKIRTGETVIRENHSKFLFDTGITFKWDASYHVKGKGKARSYHDSQIMRTFFVDEISSFLKWNNFKLIKHIRWSDLRPRLIKKIGFSDESAFFTIAKA